MKKTILGFLMLALLMASGCSKSGDTTASSGQGQALTPAPVKTKPNKGELAKAVLDGDLDRAKDLLARGADANENIETESADDVITPMTIAAAYGNAEMLGLLRSYRGSDEFTFQEYSIKEIEMVEIGAKK